MTPPLPSPLYPQRRRSREARVGQVVLGGDHPVAVQSMLTCDTMDTDACIRDSLALAEVGCEIVRVTAPTLKHARNLEAIRQGLRAGGCHVPLVADIHFKPEAALESAKWVEKVRVNPGNYADSKKFAVREYTDEEYAAELGRIREKFAPLVSLSLQRGIALRIGTNHGSLSDRIMNRYGDTPLGMVESALEFARIARDMGYHDFVFSMKASNPKVMIEAYRLLVSRLAAEGDDWNYPIHLGVTEAGDGEDGRIKSAVGIGALLADGIGDTIRVSLTEDSVHEIPVARELVELFGASGEGWCGGEKLSFDPFTYTKRASEKIQMGDLSLGGDELPRVMVTRRHYEAVAHKLAGLGDFQPELVYEDCEVVEVDPSSAQEVKAVNAREKASLVTVKDGVDLSVIAAFRLLAARMDARHPILLKDSLAPSPDPTTPFGRILLGASTRLGSLLCDGIGDAILLRTEDAPGQTLRLSYNILQAVGARIFKTDYVACPSCGRTLFNLQETTARIRAATEHLKGVKIAIMGCIVNGPGEMADADFGYVGGAPGKVNLYVGKKAVKFNIPELEAVDQLVGLIKERGRWLQPAVEATVAQPAPTA